MKDGYDYSDIIDMPRPISKRHAKMTRQNRAAQFAPFAALTGYGEAINETGRRVENKIALSDGEIETIDRKLKYLVDNYRDGITPTILYFVPDEKKAGGSYDSVKKTVRYVYPESDKVVFDDKTSIKISDIKSIAADVLDVFDK